MTLVSIYLFNEINYNYHSTTVDWVPAGACLLVSPPAKKAK
jgi:hypothetical protein